PDYSSCEINGEKDYDLLGKELDRQSKLINDAIKKAKENE
ncbi:TPA: ankyrin repeat domain-containing protein, partial [Campylobacter jejuni]|nr:ankyrin repeat domain-containing protein [Campylobacter jejuni]HDZ5091144.1 ankyrin repeat domain-containing protein [Campylobacter jejuni]HDZ5092792.1 ankyrin repeat domain-containing protein [Campylobacter jejuni]HDZ5101199.1 ankyrin repeat domain-containing protein [Campylobacter jejuni]